MGEKKTVHILKNKMDYAPLDFIKHIEASQKIAIILIQDAIEMDVSALKTKPFILSEEGLPPSKSASRKLTYAALLDLIFEYDTVVSW